VKIASQKKRREKTWCGKCVVPPIAKSIELNWSLTLTQTWKRRKENKMSSTGQWVKHAKDLLSSRLHMSINSMKGDLHFQWLICDATSSLICFTLDSINNDLDVSTTMSYMILYAIAKWVHYMHVHACVCVCVSTYTNRLITLLSRNILGLTYNNKVRQCLIVHVRWNTYVRLIMF